MRLSRYVECYFTDYFTLRGILITSVTLSAIILSVLMICVLMLSVIIVSVFVLSVIIVSVLMLSVIIVSVLMLSAIIVSVLMLSVIIVSALMLSIITVSVLMLSVITVSVLMLTVVALSMFKMFQKIGPTWRKLVSTEFKGSVYYPCIHRSRRMKTERLLDDGSKVGHPFHRLLLQLGVFRRKFSQNFAVKLVLVSTLLNSFSSSVTLLASCSPSMREIDIREKMNRTEENRTITEISRTRLL
jgi:hypothetical protein